MSKTVIIKTVLSEANDMINNIRGYPKRRTTQRLYKQWAEKSGLQTELPSVEDIQAEDVPPSVVSEDSVAGERSDSPGAAIEECNSNLLVHQDSPQEDIGLGGHDAIGVDAHPGNPGEPRKVAMFMMAEINKEQLRLAILLVLLGASLVIFCIGIVILILYTLGF